MKRLDIDRWCKDLVELANELQSFLEQMDIDDNQKKEAAEELACFFPEVNHVDKVVFQGKAIQGSFTEVAHRCFTAWIDEKNGEYYVENIHNAMLRLPADYVVIYAMVTCLTNRYPPHMEFIDNLWQKSRQKILRNNKKSSYDKQ